MKTTSVSKQKNIKLPKIGMRIIKSALGVLLCFVIYFLRGKQATPFYSAEWVFRHVFLDETRKDNLSFTYYPCGHMIYMEKASFDKFRQDAQAWFGQGK